MKIESKFHGLPGDDNGLDCRWFERLTEFQKSMTLRQVEFKNTNWPELKDKYGEFAKRRGYYYPHILPAGHLEKNFYTGIYNDVQHYLRDKDIELHTEALNLLSSQVCCFNFLFPLKKDLEKASRVLQPVLPEVDKILDIEFEYTGPESTTMWLGEPPSGKRGQNRTSIDAAVWWLDRKELKKLTLIEWKFTEKSFGTCGGYSSNGNTNRRKCHNLRVQSINPEQDCYVASGKDDRTTRRYWEHLTKAGISLERFGEHQGCPFIGPFYQLMRQYLLAAHCRDCIKDIQAVDVVVIAFRGNRSFLRVPRHLRHLGNNIVAAWNNLLTTAPPLRLVFAEELMANAEQDSWAKYILNRYVTLEILEDRWTH